MPRHILQPDDSSVCGQTCVAMAANISLDKSIEIFGHNRGTYTREVVAALRKLGLRCADKLRRVSRTKPVLPKRAVVCIRQPKPNRNGKITFHSGNFHWMLYWDGEMYDPGGMWGTEHYKDWFITSYLEIYE